MLRKDILWNAAKAPKNKRRKVEDDEESVSGAETPGPKRVRISFSGQGSG